MTNALQRSHLCVYLCRHSDQSLHCTLFCSVFDILIISIVRYTPSRRALRRSPIVELMALVRIHVIAFAADFGGDELVGKQLLNATPTRPVEKQRTTATQTCVRAWMDEAMKSIGR
jgi:hypothetical protein